MNAPQHLMPYRGEPWQGKRVLVLGLARSGLAAVALALRAGALPIACDDKPLVQLSGAQEILEHAQIPLHSTHEALQMLGSVDCVVLSPGISIDAPVPSAARARGIPVLSELEMGWRFVSGRLIAVTGTNGKTTTVSLLGEMFAQAGMKPHIAGNIGYPLSQSALDAQADDVLVVEVSSYQMESTQTLSADIASVLNLTPDHLNRHGSMDKYAALKRSLLLSQMPDAPCVLNWDDTATRVMAQGIPGTVYWFSRMEIPTRGTYVQDEKIWFADGAAPVLICRVDEVRLAGQHNLENALAACCIGMLAGIPAPVLRHALRVFSGVEHRMEYVAQINGVCYINDSKGTNPDAAVKAVETMTGPSILLAGGFDKQVSFDVLAAAVSTGGHIQQAVVFGQTAGKIADALRVAGFVRISQVKTMQEALLLAQSAAKPGDTVLFSPACASFDQFVDYEERGRQFKAAVLASQEGGGH